MWSLGVMLHVLFDGVFPFIRQSEYLTMRAIALEEPDPLTSKVSSYIKDIIKQLLNKNPDQHLSAA